MTSRSAIFLSALAFTLSTASVSAQAPPSDAKCFLLSHTFAKSTDEKTKLAASQSGFFYLGRLTGPTAEIEAKIAAEAQNITSQTAGPMMDACARVVAQKAKDIQEIGVRLSKAQPKK